MLHSWCWEEQQFPSSKSRRLALEYHLEEVGSEDPQEDLYEILLELMSPILRIIAEIQTHQHSDDALLREAFESGLRDLTGMPGHPLPHFKKSQRHTLCH